MNVCGMPGCTRANKRYGLCLSCGRMRLQELGISAETLPPHTTLREGTCKTCTARLPVPRIKGTDYCSNPCADEGRDKARREYIARHEATGVTCSEPACPHLAAPGRSGMCSGHYQRQYKGMISDEPIRLVGPRGEGYIDPAGYVRICHNGRAGVMQHRVVMEYKLGRPLEPWENVHHINGIRHDNQPENLELWVTPQPQGQRPEDLAEWVVAHYPELVAEKLAAARRPRIVEAS